jgi:hypothetical protein
MHATAEFHVGDCPRHEFLVLSRSSAPPSYRAFSVRQPATVLAGIKVVRSVGRLHLDTVCGRRVQQKSCDAFP